ncbi:hypothetical protein [uncultured Desulfuromusa sp.]|uniref:hypothetical protein n=1 Tax=uncultured Desulfuromusa sp. TaxID=219183 RepID=UPI002AA9517B|nr:hypothetical protein [uncultured Desulfuromusa sp.]
MNKKLIFTASVVALFFYAANLWALSPEIRFDMLKTKLAQQLKGQKYGDALETMNEIKSLGVATPSSLDYFEGKALFETGKKYEAYEKLEDYVSKHGKKAKYYNQAIAYLVKAEEVYNKEKQKREQERQVNIAAQKKARLEAEQRARRKQEQEALWRKEAEEFSSHPVIDKEFGTGQMWTLPVAEQYRDNPYLLIKVYGSAQEATDFCQNLNVEGYSDWRVPTLKEFSTISGKGRKFSRIKWGEKPYDTVWVWDSPEFSKDKGKFAKDKLYPIQNGQTYTDRRDHANIMCVRTDSQEKFDKYFRNKTTVVKHKGNKIMVEDRYMVSNSENYFIDPSVTFDRAVSYCKKLTLGGYNDWRLPTRKDILEKLPCHIAYELKFLKDDHLYNKIWYGSSSFVNKRKGYQDPSICKIKSASKTDHFKVRCVRDVGEKKTDKGKKTSRQKDMEGR